MVAKGYGLEREEIDLAVRWLEQRLHRVGHRVARGSQPGPGSGSG
jgi:hypothetical protein